jgi:hypothetical protein
MQDINLLQSKLKDRTKSWEQKTMLVSAFFAVIAAAVIVGAVGIYFLNNNTKKEMEKLKTENLAIEAELKSNQGQLSSAKGLQAQFVNIDTLAKTHIFWSEVFNELQQYSFKQSKLSIWQSTADGKAHIEGTVENISNLGKMILSLSTNPNFTSVKLRSVKTSSEQKAGYNFSVDMTFANELLKNR